MADIDQKFVAEMLAHGKVSYREQETLWSIAQRCARTAGVPTAGAGFLLGTQMGVVTVPGIGAIPGAVAGALAGLVGGTLSCTMLNLSVRNQLRALARGS
jgi:hypothetical protein